MKKEELLELERLDGPSLKSIAEEKKDGKPTERAEVANSILIGRWPEERGCHCTSDMNLDYYESRGNHRFQKRFK